MSTATTDDIELNAVPSAHLVNDVVDHFAWRDVRVVVKDCQTHAPLSILQDATGIVHAGEMLALMGPSGSGKTTLLNALAHRPAAAGATTTGLVLANGEQATASVLRDVSAYVEQEDALIGSITVRETMLFAARLALPSTVSRAEARRRVDDLIASFGLQAQAHTIVGTPIKKGLSGGQKKRLGVASRLVTSPHILFLDEPTSGLDSALSVEVIRYIKEIARRNHLVVVASIHQPSTTTFRLFDKLALLSGGRMCYFGAVDAAPAYFDRIGYPVAPATNPAEHLLDLVNVDLDRDGEVRARTQAVVAAWAASPERTALDAAIDAAAHAPASRPSLAKLKTPRPPLWRGPLTLLHRAWIKSHRDIVVYTIRVVMYLGLGVLMGTVFLRLSTHQDAIQPRINSIFFGGAFMSFMAVAYVPAFLEDLHTFRSERANGLVGPLAFLAANFVIGLPFLFLISLVFSVVAYWLSNFRPDGAAFLRWVLWLFLDLLAAESLVVLVASIFPVFVVALAVTAFSNGLWMAVGGFLVPMPLLNVFWKYAFHYIDYQAYVFQGMMVNEFGARDFLCDAAAPVGANGTAASYQCMYAGARNAEGIIEGTDVLRAFNIGTNHVGEWIGISIAITVGYRLLAYLVLRFLRK
ncbi:hypothetical protein HMPREF1624_05305 [Sporothrix schenckii ATCC 58251]|uniref:ABC transporter domain-containing protein n=1 Tax=Sporothrix schenckii (strain ATCC 58251 / de Perez 2211183) TaxID=1391915 RepID=U7PUB6_SPOS1|nr:hypothetical protein HMPREF1624_05305 [Sporothrix schenckii ATCC 58251]